MQYNKKIYQKYGFKIVDVPLDKEMTKELEAVSARYYMKVQQSNFTTAATVAELEDLVRLYPNHLPFRNYLYIAYKKTYADKKAIDFLNETIAKHPNYPFSKINLANEYIADNNPNKAADILGEPYDIRNVTNDEFIHETALIGYYQTAIDIELARKDSKKARELHEIIFDYDPKHEKVKSIGIKLITAIFSNPLSDHTAPNERKVTAIAQPLSGTYLRDATGQPVFYHREVKALYFNHIDKFSHKTIRELLALPRTTLIKDLEHILADMVLRFDHYQKRGIDEITQSFGIHALYLLWALKAEKSLPVVLEILKQGGEFNDFWFGESFSNFLTPTLYALAHNQLEELKSFVKTEHVYCWSRGLALEVVEQVALNEPERRPEVVAWFSDIITYHLDHPTNQGLIDSHFLDSMLMSLCNIRAIELEKEIEALFANGWVSNGAVGPIDIVKKELTKTPDPAHIDPLPTDIFDLYGGTFLNRRAKTNNEEVMKAQAEMSNPHSHDTYLTDLIMTQLLKDEGNEENRQPQLPVKRAEPKVGRNDPCPCGSGKKYKKCHGA